MTYIVALQLQGFNAIIADQRASSLNGASKNALKTGALFEGCIFGRINDEYESARFVKAFSKHIEKDANTEGAHIWECLEAFAEQFSYCDDENRAFSLLLSSRHSGRPQFYILHSRRGISPLPASKIEITTFGSGKAIIDDYINGNNGLPSMNGMSFKKRIDESQEKMRVDGVHPVEIAYRASYLLCLWLSEMTINNERKILEESGVGGVFHFIYQTAHCESLPEPAIYCFSRLIRSGTKAELKTAWFRTVCVPHTLYVEFRVPADFDSDALSATVASLIVSDEETWSDSLDVHDDAAESKRIEGDVAEQRYCYFFGFGQYYPQDRLMTSYFVLEEEQGKHKIVDKNECLTPYVIDRIKASYPKSSFDCT